VRGERLGIDPESNYTPSLVLSHLTTFIAFKLTCHRTVHLELIPGLGT